MRFGPKAIRQPRWVPEQRERDSGGVIYLAGTRLSKHYTTLLAKHLDNKTLCLKNKKKKKKGKKVSYVIHIR